ncbi:MAG: hypothetical protein Q9169_004648 [Polycauliona sp. 2 TL-2023]
MRLFTYLHPLLIALLAALTTAQADLLPLPTDPYIPEPTLPALNTTTTSSCANPTGFANRALTLPSPLSLPSYSVAPSFITQHLLFLIPTLNGFFSRAAVATFCIEQCIAYRRPPTLPTTAPGQGGNGSVCLSFNINFGAPIPSVAGSEDPEGMAGAPRWYCTGFDAYLGVEDLEKREVEGSFLDPVTDMPGVSIRVTKTARLDSVQAVDMISVLNGLHGESCHNAAGDRVSVRTRGAPHTSTKVNVLCPDVGLELWDQVELLDAALGLIRDGQRAYGAAAVDCEVWLKSSLIPGARERKVGQIQTTHIIPPAPAVHDWHEDSKQITIQFYPIDGQGYAPITNNVVIGVMKTLQSLFDRQGARPLTFYVLNNQDRQVGVGWMEFGTVPPQLGLTNTTIGSATA